MSALPSPLIAPEDLAARLTGPVPPVVLDVRWRLAGPPARPDHNAGHLPGAVFVDLHTELAGEPGAGGRHPLPDPAALQASLRRAGVREDSAVVVHDDGGVLAAGRAWWLLRWAGLPPGRVAVLDGGFAAWTAAGLPVTAEPSRPEPGDVVVRPGGMPVLDADEAASVATRGVLIDARAGERYRGETEPIDPRAGHVPGAVNLPVTELAGPDGRMRPVPEVDHLFDRLCLTDGVTIGAYCGSGVTAAALVLAAEYAGVAPAARPVELYAGSWSQWCTDPDRPVATGDRS